MTSARRAVLLFALACLASASCVPPPPPQRTAERPTEDRTTVQLIVTQRPIENRSTAAPNRRQCTAVMVLSEGPAKPNEEALAALEGNLISRGIRVVSSAMTGRVVSDPGLLEGATQLSQLERAIVLAKKANVDCVFQLQRLDIGVRNVSRYYYLNGPGPGFREVSPAMVSTLDASRGWTVTGPEWEISGKVIDVENADVLAIVDISQTSVYVRPTQTYHLQAVSGVTVPNTDGLRVWRFDDTGLLAKALMSLLAVIIEGPPTQSGPDPWGEKKK